MSSEADLYSVLGVSPDAEQDVIQAAYRALMRKYHPDKNPSAEAAEKARVIASAYEVLGNATRRAEYDGQRRQQSGSTGKSGTTEKTYEERRAQAQAKGQQAARSIHLKTETASAFLDTLFGVNDTVEKKRKVASERPEKEAANRATMLERERLRVENAKAGEGGCFTTILGIFLIGAVIAACLFVAFSDR